MKVLGIPYAYKYLTVVMVICGKSLLYGICRTALIYIGKKYMRLAGNSLFLSRYLKFKGNIRKTTHRSIYIKLCYINEKYEKNRYIVNNGVVVHRMAFCFGNHGSYVSSGHVAGTFRRVIESCRVHPSGKGT